MKDITPLIEFRFNAKKQKGKTDEASLRLYHAAACMEAYIEVNVPEEYHNYNLDDFEGIIEEGEGDRRKKVKVLDEKIVAEARKQLIDFCWKDILKGEEYDKSSWLVRSLLGDRRRDGTSLVIYGPKWVADRTAHALKRKASGKTMLAAIVLKEVIKLRLLPGHTADSYAWIDYTTLIHRLIAKAQGDNSFNNEIMDYGEVDWLVVDGISIIEKGSDAQKSFRANLLDRVFTERREAGLPNILVFQDNLRQVEDFQEQFGTALNSIVNSQRTKRISLVSE
jgi:hypothetical protein